MEQFPTIKLLVERGATIAILVSVLPFVLAGAATWLFSMHWLLLLCGLFVSLVLLLLMKSYVELVRVISEMLLPK
jgi:hypothetical protein